MEKQLVDVAVIGAGQSGLSAAYDLQRRGLKPAGGAGGAATYAVFDAEDGPGGAWRHRWKSLLMATVNGISDLPGIARPDVNPAEPSSEFLERYFAGYELDLGLAVRRPHVADYVSAEEFPGRHPARRRRDPLGDRVPGRARTPRPAPPPGPGRGIAMDGTQAAAERRVHLVGYGPSSSTIGANRAGRAAVAAILKLPGIQPPRSPALSDIPAAPNKKAAPASGTEQS